MEKKGCQINKLSYEFTKSSEYTSPTFQPLKEIPTNTQNLRIENEFLKAQIHQLQKEKNMHIKLHAEEKEKLQDQIQDLKREIQQISKRSNKETHSLKRKQARLIQEFEQFQTKTRENQYEYKRRFKEQHQILKIQEKDIISLKKRMGNWVYRTEDKSHKRYASQGFLHDN